MIYLSPHFDDVVYSCGGLVFDQARGGEKIQIWTVCAAGPDPSRPLPPFALELVERWGTGPEATRQRAAEDRAACVLVGAQPRHLNIPDCIYRFLPDGRPLIESLPDLWEKELASEQGLIGALAGELGAAAAGETLVVPLAIGRHIDHRLARAAAEQAAHQFGLPLLYYADYPYAVNYPEHYSEQTAGLARLDTPISAGGLAAWQAAAAAHASQISTFWKDEAELREAFRAYWADGGGRLWRQNP